MNEVIARELMEDYAERTQIGEDGASNRYLWTDAFAVCNLLGLAGSTGNQWYLHRAEELIDDVHRVLGRHRPDDDRTGWISGLSDEEAKSHPTKGGLRIGKPKPERAPEEPHDDIGEGDRDGQYFHYLTKWMHALDRMGRERENSTCNRWARELAETACDAFIYQPQGDGPPRMCWKMSIDLARPLVRSMGQHDPLDGFVTCLQLRTTARKLQDREQGPTLGDELGTLAAMVETGDWTTTDPLGIGGLLIDATRLTQLRESGEEDEKLDDVLDRVVDTAVDGLEKMADSKPWEQSPQRRIPFRELGTAIGLQGVRDVGLTDHDERLGRYISLGERLAEYWYDAAHRDVGTWREWRDINEVMLATALVPTGFFGLP